MNNSSSENDSLDNTKSWHSLSTYKERKFDTFNFRLEFIEKILEGNGLDSLIYKDGINTEAFINPYSSSDDNKSKNAKFILNKKIHNFYKIINQIGGKLRYVKSGTTGHTFKGIIDIGDGNSINYGLKVAAYPKKEKYGDMYDVERPENAELMMIRLLSYFVVKGQTPHITLPVSTFNTSIKPFINLVEDSIVDSDNRKYKEFVEKYKEDYYHDNVSVLISEWANRGDLLEFIRKDKRYKRFRPLDWKVFFFQIISILAVIQSKYPSFRHNDMKANNILVHKIAKRSAEFSYTICRKKYKVPNIGYLTKIWDFDFACIPGIVNNSKVNDDWTTKINVNPTQNKYYDMHYFFNTLIKKGFFPEFMTDGHIPKEAKDFVNRIVPNKYKDGKYIAKRGRILIDDEYLTPNNVLLYDPYFKDFRTDNASTKIPKTLKYTKNKKKDRKDKNFSLPKASVKDISELRKENVKYHKMKKYVAIESSSSESYVGPYKLPESSS